MRKCENAPIIVNADNFRQRLITTGGCIPFAHLLIITFAN
jgi:hypothetical protein